MAFKVMLDANIILDYALKRDDKAIAKEILSLVIQGTIQGYITPSIVHICAYWLTKAYGHEKAKRILLSLLTDVKVLDIPHDTTIAALHSSIRDIEDALQYYTALHHKLDYFISRDKQLLKEAIPLLPIYTPLQFLKEIKSK
jgi:predicted nucleic acid-binding protein